jgi:hypothetical protein
VNLRADGRQLFDGSTLTALCQDPDDAAAIATAVNDSGQIDADLRELVIAAGLDHAAGWSRHDALAEVTRQVRMVRRTMQTRQFDHHATTG